MGEMSPASLAQLLSRSLVPSAFLLLPKTSSLMQVKSWGRSPRCKTLAEPSKTNPSSKNTKKSDALETGIRSHLPQLGTVNSPRCFWRPKAALCTFGQRKPQRK